MRGGKNVDSLFWLGLNLLTIIILGYFSMMEMAIVSFNKVRLQFFISQGSRSARWLDYLLSHPSRLFGTTLIGVNVAMMLGSEFARKFHASLGINPDWAPLSQVLLVIIFGELAPQFAARRFSEHVALLGASFLYFTSKIMAPLVGLLGSLSKIANRLLGGKETQNDIFLTLEELEKILIGSDEERFSGKGEEFDPVVSNIFRLRNLNAKKAMISLSEVFLLPSHTTVISLRKTLTKPLTWIPIYHHQSDNIVGIVFLRDLVRASDMKRIRDYAVSPWFITENTPLLQVLKQFKKNKAIVAVVIDSKGRAKGILSLDNILDGIFGKLTYQASKVVIDVTVPGTMSLADFNKEFNTNLEEEECETLSELFLKKLDHHPEVGESLFFPPFELTIKESSLLEIKKVLVHTRYG